MPNYTITSVGEIYRQCFVVSNPTNGIKYIDAIEIVPSNISAVYAYFIYTDTSTIPLSLDLADTTKGYTNFGGIGSASAKPIFGWVNGSEINYFPSQFPLQIDSGSRYIIQVQYAEDAGGKIDSAQMNIRYYNTAPMRYLKSEMLLSHSNNLLNPPLFVKADSMKDFYESVLIPNNLTLYSITPLSHHICKTMMVYAVSPLNDTIELFDADECGAIWNQGFYVFDKPKFIPSGSTLFANALYDNTVSNGENPNNPPQDIGSGFNEDEEQLIFYFQTAPYQIGDENIIIDSNPHLTHYQNCQYINQPTQVSDISTSNSFSIFPNPTNEVLNINSKNSNSYVIELFDVYGRMVYSEISISKTQIQTSNFHNGVYFLRTIQNEKSYTSKIIIQH